MSGHGERNMHVRKFLLLRCNVENYWFPTEHLKPPELGARYMNQSWFICSVSFNSHLIIRESY